MTPLKAKTIVVDCCWLSYTAAVDAAGTPKLSERSQLQDFEQLPPWVLPSNLIGISDY